MLVYRLFREVTLHSSGPKSRRVKCNFTKQPVDQHRLINLYNLHVLIYYILFIYTKFLEVNLFAFAYRLFHADFSSIDRALIYLFMYLYAH